jgi:hypothetical protein
MASQWKISIVAVFREARIWRRRSERSIAKARACRTNRTSGSRFLLFITKLSCFVRFQFSIGKRGSLLAAWSISFTRI